MAAPLTDAQVAHWREHGYVVIEDFLDAETVARARGEAERHFPSRADFDAQPERRPRLTHGMSFKVLPYAGDELNRMPFDPAIVGAVEQLLGTDDLRLVQSVLRQTYGGPDTVDQELHRDVHDNSLLLPDPDNGFGHVPVLVYLTDVGEGDAPTYVVSDQVGRDRPLLPFYRSREDDPELYAHERPNLVRAGTVMFYSMTVFHRGSAGTDPRGSRLAHHLAYRPAGMEWMDFFAWPPALDTEQGRRCIEQLTPRQRQLLGIPAPGDRYWTKSMIDAFVERYPAADPTPYVAALA